MAPFFADWYTGEPNNAGGEDCGSFWTGSKGYKYNDVPCTLSLRYLCEAIDCPPGFKAAGTKCYKQSTDKKNFADAKAACNAMGAILAEPMDTAEQKAAYTLITPVVTTFVGLNDATTEGK